MLLVMLLGVGCAHEEDVRPAREPLFESAPPPAPAYDPPPTARPRLSQTVTLGQEDYAPAAAPAPAPTSPAGNVHVTVNNNIVQPPVVYGGYGYGYGYGYGASGRGGDGRTGLGRGGGSAWRGSGWEGAQRTAPPGQTPAVGGNWAPPPSYGPAQMK